MPRIPWPVEEEDQSGVVEAELTLDSRGVPNGVFRMMVTQGEKTVWTVGNMEAGVVKDECWVVTQEEVSLL